MTRPILIIGDSLTVACEHLIPAATTNDHTIKVRAERGWRIRHALPVVQSAGQLQCLVIALGTNNIPDASTQITEDVDAVIATCPEDTRLRWIDVASTTRHADPVNDALRQRLAPGQIVRWTQMVSDQPGLLGVDGIHLSAAGIQARAAITRRAATQP